LKPPDRHRSSARGQKTLTESSSQPMLFREITPVVSSMQFFFCFLFLIKAVSTGPAHLIDFCTSQPASLFYIIQCTGGMLKWVPKDHFSFAFF